MKHDFLPVVCTPLAILSLSFAMQAAETSKPPVVPADLPPTIELRQPGVKLTLLAEHPALVTPTGIDVDSQGQIWTVACHTHFRPAEYEGPERDEVLVFDRNGKNRRVFYNKTKATMNLKVGRDGWIYLAERDRILRVKDSDGDGRGDTVEDLAVLVSSNDYPHNGLSGLAWHPSGDLLFTLGENRGANWALTGSDRRVLTGRGEGGVFRCRPDGSLLERLAIGFWNPFGLLARSNGEMFACDNDPGSRPPCRLLYVVPGADYGYQRVYGPASVHPFVAWNGELRGTLGMVHPVGEGPCAVCELGGGVLVPSWSNHRVDYFPLSRGGAGYTAQRVELLSGSDFFRPTCMAPGPDGAFYLNDWVLSSYPLHSRGRLWKLEFDRTVAKWVKPAWDPPTEAFEMASALRDGRPTRVALAERQLFDLVRGTDRYLADAALTALARLSKDWTPEHVKLLPANDRLWALVALRRVNIGETKWVRLLLDDADPEIRFECLRWIADGVLKSFAPDVERMLARPDLDYRQFEALLATWNTLRGKPEMGVTDLAVLLDKLKDPATPARLKGFALRPIPPMHPKLKIKLLDHLLALNDPDLTREVVRTLAAREADDARTILAQVAADTSRGAELRADAISGLAATANPVWQKLLLSLSTDGDKALRDEALRSLRTLSLDEPARATLTEVGRRYPDSAALVQAVLDPASLTSGRPPLEDTKAWLARLAAVPGKADLAAGRRVFFHSKVALCSTCHRRSGRGNVVGPDLSLVGQQGARQAILQSILEPSREVAPQFYPTQLVLEDGTMFTGILLRSSDRHVFRDLTGKERVFFEKDIAERAELKTSVMPVGLPTTLTDGELRDLLAFLVETKNGE